MGLTLTSLMIAMALSGVISVAGVRLVANQMKGMQILDLVDKGDAIYKFYSNLLHDDMVWWCSLYDGIEDPKSKSPNKALRNWCLRQRRLCRRTRHCHDTTRP